jgi:hypothetical protein
MTLYVDASCAGVIWQAADGLMSDAPGSGWPPR